MTLTLVWSFKLIELDSLRNSHQCLNVSTTPITAFGCWQCLSLSVVQLKSKHCRKPHCRNGPFGPWMVADFSLCSIYLVIYEQASEPYSFLLILFTRRSKRRTSHCTLFNLTKNTLQVFFLSHFISDAQI